MDPIIRLGEQDLIRGVGVADKGKVWRTRRVVAEEQLPNRAAPKETGAQSSQDGRGCGGANACKAPMRLTSMGKGMLRRGASSQRD